MIGNAAASTANLFLTVFRLLDLFTASLLLLDDSVTNQPILGLILLGSFR